MRTRQRLRGTDIAIFSSFPVAAVLFLFCLGLAVVFGHTELGRFAGILLEIPLLIVVASFIVLPLWVVLHIVFNRGRSSEHVLWIQSGLAGAWLALGLLFWLPEWLGGRVSLLIAGLAGSALALTPYTISRLRSSSGRTPTG